MCKTFVLLSERNKFLKLCGNNSLSVDFASPYILDAEIIITTCQKNNLKQSTANKLRIIETL